MRRKTLTPSIQNRIDKAKQTIGINQNGTLLSSQKSDAHSGLFSFRCLRLGGFVVSTLCRPLCRSQIGLSEPFNSEKLRSATAWQPVELITLRLESQIQICDPRAHVLTITGIVVGWWDDRRLSDCSPSSRQPGQVRQSRGTESTRGDDALVWRRSRPAQGEALPAQTGGTPCRRSENRRSRWPA